MLNRRAIFRVFLCVLLSRMCRKRAGETTVEKHRSETFVCSRIRAVFDLERDTECAQRPYKRVRGFPIKTLVFLGLSPQFNLIQLIRTARDNRHSVRGLFYR